MTAKRDREIRALVEAAGLSEVDRNTTGAGRIRLLLRAQNGHERAFIVSAANGDPRADKNALAEMKRFARLGMPDAPPAPPAPAPAPAPIQPPAPTPAPTPMPAPAPAPAPAQPAARAPRNVLSLADNLKLCTWLQKADLSDCYAMPEAIARASAGTGLSLSDSNLRSAMKAVGVALPERPRAAIKASAGERILAQAVISIMDQLGLKVGEDLLALAAS